MFLFDQENNVVNDPNDHAVDVEYQPPTVSQLDRPMSVSRALLGTVVPDETLSDIARMGNSGGSAVIGEGIINRGRGSNDGNQRQLDRDVVISMDQAEGI